MRKQDNNANVYYNLIGSDTDSSVKQTPRKPARRLTEDEERRRLEEARLAAIQEGRISEEELRRRRAEQQLLHAGQPQSELRSSGIPSEMSRSAPLQARSTSRRQRRREIHLNAGAILYVVLIAGVFGVSLYQIGQNSVERKEEAPYTFNEVASMEELESDFAAILGESGDPASTEGAPVNPTADAPSSGSPAGSDQAGNSGEAAVDPKPVGSAVVSDNPAFTATNVSNALLDEGALVLVNYNHPYAKANAVALTNAYEARMEHQGRLKIATSDAAMEEEAFAALEELVKGLEADTGCHDLMINSGYRSVADQQAIYDSYLESEGQDYVDAYVARPGYSEHHTGLSCDLTFYLDEGYSVPISDHEFGFWMTTMPQNYGFIRRYPEDKVEITRISYEPWHYRYVGIPHAYICTDWNLCLEEYISLVKEYTPDTKLLYVKNDSTVEEVSPTELPQSGGWLVYYAPMTAGGETAVRIPVFGEAAFSGNNEDGFIVTVTLP